MGAYAVLKSVLSGGISLTYPFTVLEYYLRSLTAAVHTFPERGFLQLNVFGGHWVYLVCTSSSVFNSETSDDQQGK